MTMFIQMKVKLRKINMLDDFFIRALIAGIGVALVTGPLGCFVVWRMKDVCHTNSDLCKHQ